MKEAQRPAALVGEGLGGLHPIARDGSALHLDGDVEVAEIVAVGEIGAEHAHLRYIVEQLAVAVDACNARQDLFEQAEQMQAKLASALDEGRSHLVSVRNGKGGRLDIEFSPELGDVGRAFAEASKSAPNNRPR